MELSTTLKYKLKRFYLQFIISLNILLDRHIEWLGSIDNSTKETLTRIPVRFIFETGLSDRKTLFAHSIRDTMLWKGKSFRKRSIKNGVIQFKELVDTDGR